MSIRLRSQLWLPAASMLVLLSACGGSGDIESARNHLAHHRLEAAEAQLAGRVDERAAKLLAQVKQAQATRAERLREVERVAQSDALDEARLALREIARSDADPIVRDQAGRFLSILANRIAEETVAGHSYAPYSRTGSRTGSVSREPTRTVVPAGGPRPAPGGAPTASRAADGVASAREDRPGETSPVAKGPVATSPDRSDRERRPVEPGAPAPSLADARATQAPSPAPTPVLARDLERQGSLDQARAAWVELAFEAEPGPERTYRVARARSLERRLVLRSELAAAVAAQPGRFGPEAVEEADEQGLTVAGERRRWGELDEGLLRRLGSRANLSSEARLGLVLERLASGRRGDPASALAELAQIVKRGELEEAEAFAILADFRQEPLPEGGYVFERGGWVTRAEFDRAALQARIQDLTARLGRARGAEADEHLAGLVELGEAARPALLASLEGRLERAGRTVTRGNTLTALERLAERRRELDRRREQALALIFDEATYFYPYSGAGLPQGKSEADYWPVQRRVDELVARVEEVWSEGASVRLPAAFTEALDDLRWTLGVGAELGLALEAPRELPAWIGGLPALPQVDLATFAWTASEREGLAYDRAVLERNQRSWAEWARKSEERTPRDEERRQVSITNEYRRMLGRRALAWNPDVQLAARWHSVYMADSGNFGHLEPEAERRTPFDRMRLAGYDHGASENCHMGNGSAEGAHLGWRRSSGHHRNLLMPSHREMASALASVYWTQNFGSGTRFLDELEGWQD